VNPSPAIVAKRLRSFYPDSDLGNKNSPLNELAFIVLSGQTDEKLCQVAYRQFKRAFPTWQGVADAPLRKLENPIRRAGLSHQKARYIKAIALKLRRDFGAVTLRGLPQLSTSKAEKYLCSLPGVGIKSARCVLLYSLSRPVFPADIHCLRVMQRLGWIEPGWRRGESVADEAQALIPPRLRRLLHIRFVQHGRLLCGARPRCGVCPLNNCCPTARTAS